MNARKRIGLTAAAVMAPCALLAGTLPANANEDPPTPIAVELLTPRSRFTDRINAKFRVKVSGSPTQVLNVGDPSRLVVARITVQPGARFPWHIHPGPVIVTVAEGDLTLTYATDCVDRQYATGTSFVDPGDSIHTARNRTDGETVLIATFLDAPPEGPLTVTTGIEPPDDCHVPVGDAAAHGGGHG